MLVLTQPTGGSSSLAVSGDTKNSSKSAISSSDSEDGHVKNLAGREDEVWQLTVRVSHILYSNSIDQARPLRFPKG